MKFQSLLLAAVAACHGPRVVLAEDRTVTRVVKVLQGMLEQSKADGDKERDLYAKFKCYCDKNEESKKASIGELTEQIAAFESDIDETQAASALLSKEVAHLAADMASNEESRKTGDALREKENKAFVAKEKDLTEAIEQMKAAIKTLAEVGADQRLESAADHKQYMVGAGLLELRTSVLQALNAASSFISSSDASKLSSFLQGPLTGTYSAQSGEVVGILTNMRETFEANLEEAQTAEEKAAKQHSDFSKDLKTEYKDMSETYDSKQGTLGSNDAKLSTLRGQLTEAKKQKREADDFLSKLLDMCAEKKKQYEQRVALRTNEEAALAEAISILNSDEAFGTFGSVAATKSGSTGPSFVQRRAAVRIHRAVSAGSTVQASLPRAFLERRGASGSHSRALQHIQAMIKAHNPFETVLAEIKKMLALIKEEGKADVERKKWCEDERAESKKTIKEKGNQIATLASEVDSLTATIKDPVTGLLKQISTSEEDLSLNLEDQASQTEERKQENMEYQKNAADLDKASELLQSAIKVLKKYYESIADQPSFVQVWVAKDAPAPPSTWDDKYEGQRNEGGSSVISMLEFILDNTNKEEKLAHDTELMAQHDFEDSMEKLKDSEASLQKSLASLKLSLAEKEELLQGKKKDLSATTQEKEAVEAYLVEIKPGCDFIMKNIGTRDAHRVAEITGLQNAVQSIKGTPAFRRFTAEQHDEDLGDCEKTCKAAESEAHAECRACLAGTSIPGYCAGHPGTLGC